MAPHSRSIGFIIRQAHERAVRPRDQAGFPRNRTGLKPPDVRGHDQRAHQKVWRETFRCDLRTISDKTPRSRPRDETRRIPSRAARQPA
jgi:hypothetical protein